MHIHQRVVLKHDTADYLGDWAWTGCPHVLGSNFARGRMRMPRLVCRRVLQQRFAASVTTFDELGVTDEDSAIGGRGQIDGAAGF